MRKRHIRFRGRAQTGRHPKTDVRSVFATPMTSPANVADFCDRLRAIGVRLEIGVEGAADDLDRNLVAFIREEYGIGRMAARFRTRKIRDRAEALQRLAEMFAKTALKFNREFEAALAALEDDVEREKAKKDGLKKPLKRVRPLASFSLD